ncbi:MAG: hypothetical protein RLZZ262_2544 [Bacteroidota bacterium]|jgi:hypothetical protein
MKNANYILIGCLLLLTSCSFIKETKEYDGHWKTPIDDSNAIEMWLYNDWLDINCLNFNYCLSEKRFTTTFLPMLDTIAKANNVKIITLKYSSDDSVHVREFGEFLSDLYQPIFLAKLTCEIDGEMITWRVAEN